MKSEIEQLNARNCLRKAGPLVILFVIGMFLGYSATAQQKEYFSGAAEQVIPGAVFVKEGRNTPYPSFVRFDADHQQPFSTFFNWLKKSVPADQATGFRLLKTMNDELGYTHYFYAQTVNEIPIDQSYYNIHVRDNKVVSFNGFAMAPKSTANSKPVLTEVQALSKATTFMGAEKYKWQVPFWEKEIKERTRNESATYYPKGELCWRLMPDNSSLLLAYKFDIHAATPDRFERVYVDAATGQILATLPMESNCAATSVSTIFNGTRTVYTEKYTTTQYRVRDDCQTAAVRIRDWNSSTCTNSAVDIESSTNTWTSNNQRFATSVLWCTKQSYLYWKNVRLRNSYDNANGSINGYINAVFNSASSGCSPYTDNASMSFSGGTLKVGLGSSGTLANSWSSLDIIGHEYTHAVTGSSAQLVYSNESGALNESFSDIFGEVIENYVTGTNDWLVGDDRTSGYIRSMANPNLKNDPDTYLGTNWYTGTGDNGGVHINSGVQNFWFYLLSVGGSGTNDNGDAFNVPGIGLTDAASIAARNLTVYLGNNSDYVDARTYSIQAAIDLFGECSGKAISCAKAWQAVGVDKYSPVYIDDVCGTILSGTFVKAISLLRGGLNCTNTIGSGASITYYNAADRIVLYPGFTAPAGSRFIAYISDCAMTQRRDAAPQYSPADEGVPLTQNRELPVDDVSQDLTIAPNPFRSSFKINMGVKQATKAQISIFNSIGIRVRTMNGIMLTTGANTISVDGSNLQKGVYVVEINTGETKKVRKVVKLE